MFRKIILSVLVVAILVASIFTPEVLAQDTGTQDTTPAGSWYNPEFNEWSTKVFGSPENEIFGERYTYAQVKWIIYSFAAMLTGTSSEQLSCLSGGDIGECLQSLISNGEPQNYLSKNFSPENRSATDPFLRVPISGVYYIKSALEKLSLVPEAKAQAPGFGFEALDSIQKLWRASRNAAFSLFIIIIIVTSFMIMFKVKISPQAVISVQSALPKIVIALVLITFSYAIAGFLIDLVYLVIGFVSVLLVQSGIYTSTTDWQNVFGYMTEGPLRLGAFGAISAYFGAFVIILPISLLQAIATLGATGIIFGILGLLLYPIIIIVAAVVLLIAIFKLLWLLLQTFVNIILLVVAAPFTIAIGAVAQGVGFGTWIRSMLSNLSVYPVVGIMFTLAFMFISGAYFSVINAIYGSGSTGIDIVSGFIESIFGVAFHPDIVSGNLWSPPLTAGTGMYSLLWLGASFVLIIMTPQAANMIKAIVQGQPFGYGTALLQAVAPGQYPGGYALGDIAKGKIPPYYPFSKELKTAYDRLAATRYGGKITGGVEAGATGLKKIIDQRRER